MTTPTPVPQTTAAGSRAEARLRAEVGPRAGDSTPWWALPFRRQTWTRTLYAVIALPAGLAGSLVALVGGRSARIRVASAEAALTTRLLGVRPRASGRRADDLPTPSGRGAIAHGLVAAPLNVMVLAVTLYGWSIVPMNLAYPLRAGEPPLDGAWGGPSLGGAWAVHALGGLAFLFLMPWIVRGMTAMQAAIARRFLA